MTIGIIGCGAMGGALLTAFAGQSEHTLLAYDRTPEKVRLLGGTYVPLMELAERSDIVLIAVKPQGFGMLVAELGGALAGKVVVSVMAGIALTQLRRDCGTEHIVRCMPNMPVRLGQGVLGWYGEGLAEEEREVLSQLFDLAGVSMELESEAMLEDLTLISGCGPAYIAYFCELLQKEAMQMGFAEAEAERMVLQTLVGTTEVLKTGIAPGELRGQVTSKGGVTAAVLAGFAEGKLPEALAQGLAAGRRRMDELKGS